MDPVLLVLIVIGAGLLLYAAAALKIVSDNYPLRGAVRVADRMFGEKLAMALVRRLLTPGAPEGVPTATARLLIDDFRDYLQSASTETVWELLQSRSKPAQEFRQPERTGG